MRYGSFRVFAEGELSTFLDDRKRELASEIRSADENYILNVSEDQYIEYLIEKYTVAPITLDFDAMSVATREEMIPAEAFPFGFNVFEGKSYPKPVFRYHIPVDGDQRLLRLSPSTRVMWSADVTMDGNELCFDIVSFHDNDAEPVKRAADERIQNIRRQAEHVLRDITSFNGELNALARQAVQARKQQLLSRRNLAQSLGVPIRKKENVPDTYAIPTPRVVRKVAPRPNASTAEYRPHPTLDQGTYADILATLHDLGVVFERMPSLYADRGEEDLRDQILLYLTPRYEGSATGETFNSTGKTDILMRHENSNVFVAECLIWAGPKHFLAKIDQLLSYLTWRDSKAAVVAFVRNKDLTTVLAGVEEHTPRHPNFVALVDRPNASWFNYRFHLPADKNLEVRIAVMLFHTPPDG